MRVRWEDLRAGLLPALLCVGLVVAGCGGGSSSSASSAGVSTEPSAQFLKPNAKNTIAKFGEEAPTEEREAVSKIVVENLTARQAADFATQCQTLSLAAIHQIPGAKTRGACPAALKKLAEPLSGTKEIRKDTLDGSIAAMRVRDDEGYALYHGDDGSNYAVPLEKEGGTWKVSSLTAIII